MCDIVLHLMASEGLKYMEISKQWYFKDCYLNIIYKTSVPFICGLNESTLALGQQQY